MPTKPMSPMQEELLRRRRSNSLTPNVNLLPTTVPQHLAPPPPPPPSRNLNTNMIDGPSYDNNKNSNNNDNISTRSNPPPKPQRQSAMRRYLLDQRRAQSNNNNRPSSSIPSSPAPRYPAAPTTTPVNNELHRHQSMPTPIPSSSISSSSRNQPALTRKHSLRSPAASNFQLPETTSYGVPLRKHKALLVGIGYSTHRFLRPLPGCRTDVCNMFELLTGPLFSFSTDNIRVLSDELDTIGPVKVQHPTRMNILKDLNWLTHQISPGDSVFFFFAGHGDFVVDFSGDEIETGLDQCIMPIDYEVPPPHGAGKLPKGAPAILDDTIYERLVRRVPDGAKVTAVVDACRSGTVCDLPVNYSEDGQVQFRNGLILPPRLQHRHHMSAGGFVLFSGCSDSQLSADMVMQVGDEESGETVSCGIMSRSFIDSVLEMCEQRDSDYNGVEKWTYGMLMGRVRQLVSYRAHETLPDYVEKQQPQFSSSHPIDIWNTPFSM